MILGRLDRYILKLVFTPLITTLVIAALLLTLEKMLQLFDFVVNQGGPVKVVFEMLANMAPRFVGYGLPIGLFLGIVLAFRKLSLQSELDAITSSGLGLVKLLRPLMILATGLMLINIYLVGWIQPYAQYTYDSLIFELRSGALGASIKVGEFVDVGNNTTLRIEESRNQGAELIGIFLERREANGNSIAVTAKHGGFYSTPDNQTILLRLFDGVLVDLNDTSERPRVLTFARQDLKIKLPEMGDFHARGGAEHDMTFTELWENMDDANRTQDERNAISGQFHWRLMHSLSFLLLPFLAMPLGITNKRNPKSTGLIIGMAMLIVYNEVMEGMETAIAHDGMSPFLTIWALFALLAFVSLMIFRTMAFKIEGEPLKWVDVTIDYVSRPVRLILRRFKRSEL